MDPATIASFAIPAIGSAVSGLFGSNSAKRQQDQSLQIAREQMEFQERMSNTAHQREIADLKAAGLNPILSVNSGASTPSGASAQAYSTGESGINSALSFAQGYAGILNSLAQLELTKANTDKVNLESNLMPFQSVKNFLGSLLSPGSNSAKNSVSFASSKINQLTDFARNSGNPFLKAGIEKFVRLKGVPVLDSNYNLPNYLLKKMPRL